MFRPSTSYFSAALLPLLLAGSMASAQPLPQTSPFLPAPASVPAAASTTSGYELIGMVAQSSGMMLSVRRQSDKHSFWLPVGGTVDEVTVVGYNAATDEAVIRANGRTFTLQMRKAVIVPGKNPLPAIVRTPTPTPTVAPSPDAPPPVPVEPPSAQQQKETEARMLVSDLLEIGVQQRKAYAEAQRQAAERKASGASAEPAPPPHSP